MTPSCRRLQAGVWQLETVRAGPARFPIPVQTSHWANRLFSEVQAQDAL